MRPQYQSNVTQVTDGDHADPTMTVDRRLRVDSVTSTAASATGAQTSVAASASDVTILAANAARKRATITNDSATATLYLLLASGTSSATNYSVALPPGGLWEETVYTGVIKGIWSAASGSARVTENT